ncbi:MAG TPA: hypothetical protein ENH23_01975 [candidate division Zixibacteria bacterium]|nr:hypothetical protein [candidate division Zixibacteria bacterium]
MPISKLMPDEKLSFRVLVKSVKRGSAIFRTTVKYTEFKKEIIIEEPTTVSNGTDTNKRK